MDEPIEEETIMLMMRVHQTASMKVITMRI